MVKQGSALPEQRLDFSPQIRVCTASGLKKRLAFLRLPFESCVI
jgi:hypothetical protein